MIKQTHKVAVLGKTVMSAQISSFLMKNLHLIQNQLNGEMLIVFKMATFLWYKKSTL
jgi:hypothetical protein